MSANRACAVLALLCVLVVPAVASARAAVARPIEQPGAVLAKYEAAMDAVVLPKFLRFEYAVEQAGPHDFAQTHRVYRSGLVERDEILSVDGQVLPTPAIRIVRNRINRYNVTQVAPRVRDYTFSYVGHHREGARIDYVFTTLARAPGAFNVSAVSIDGTHFFPRTVAYSANGDGLTGHGTMTFAPQEAYWVIVQATVSARYHGKIARERLSFHNYDFPRSLPQSTFTQPRSRAATT